MTSPSPKPGKKTRKRAEWSRGYYCAVAILLKETQAPGAANTDCRNLFRQGGDWQHADSEDIETFKLHGLIK